MDKETDDINDQINESTRLLTSKTADKRVYWYRWIILLEISVFSLVQNAYGSLWNPIDKSAKAVYNMTTKDFYYIGIYGNVGTAIYIPINMWFLVNKGLKLGVLPGVGFMLLGIGIPLLPFANNGKRIAIGIAQLLNGFSLAPVACVPAYVSNIWFPHNERILATGIMTLIGNLGCGAAFFLGPILVKEPNGTIHNATNVDVMRHEIEMYLVIELVLAGVLFTAMLLFFPNHPPNPPSNSAIASRLDFWQGMRSLVSNKKFWVAVIIFMLTYGTYASWLSIMPLLYTQLSQKTTGLMGGFVSLIGAGVGIVFCWLADRIQKHFYIIFIVLIVASFLSATYLVTISLNWSHTPPFSFTKVGLWISFCILGGSMNALFPIAIELVATVAFPVNEGISSYVIVWIAVAVGVIYYLVLNVIPDVNAAQYILLISISLAMPLLFFSKPKSNPRLELDFSTQEEMPDKE